MKMVRKPLRRMILNYDDILLVWSGSNCDHSMLFHNFTDLNLHLGYTSWDKLRNNRYEDIWNSYKVDFENYRVRRDSISHVSVAATWSARTAMN